jgi:hypothetical protein
MFDIEYNFFFSKLLLLYIYEKKKAVDEIGRINRDRELEANGEQKQWTPVCNIFFVKVLFCNRKNTTLLSLKTTYKFIIRLNNQKLMKEELKCLQKKVFVFFVCRLSVFQNSPGTKKCFSIFKLEKMIFKNIHYNRNENRITKGRI